MVCEHLRPLEQALSVAGFRETCRGAPWSRNCREWVYYDCCLALPELRKRFSLASCVVDHVHRGTHDGSESGFVCNLHNDAVMGVHPDVAGGGYRVFGG
jgi:hypothetical protein